MKLSRTILALCAISSNTWRTNAFSVQAPKAPSSALKNSQFDDIRTREGVQDQVSSPGGGMTEQTRAGSMQPVRNIWETAASVIVQGGSLRTWSTPTAERLQVSMRTEGRPLNANIELWQGPDNTPQKLNIYIEDGDLRPLNAVIETPRGPNSVAIYNTGQLEFPFEACVEADMPDAVGIALSGLEPGSLRTVQGGALKSYPFAPPVESVQVILRTDGRPLNARIELLQGPNNQKQVMDIYTEDGMERPFFAVVETPGTGNVVRILNTAPMEYPMMASVEPYRVEERGNGSGWVN
jgi:hypothetical protein